MEGAPVSGDMRPTADEAEEAAEPGLVPAWTQGIRLGLQEPCSGPSGLAACAGEPGKSALLCTPRPFASRPGCHLQPPPPLSLLKVCLHVSAGLQPGPGEACRNSPLPHGLVAFMALTGPCHPLAF